MANIIDYLKKYGNVSFKDEKFNELDAAIFARLSYIDFSDFIKAKKYFSKKALTKVAANILALQDSTRFKLKEDNILLQEITNSTRYKNIYIFAYVKETDQAKVKQFSAISFLNKDKTNNFLIISFRGTDGTYTGWKEDFEMCYKPFIPSQKESEKYAKKLTRFSLKKKIILVGHSKGGNLAVYSSIFLNPKKIQSVYIFDSPGFNKSFLNEEGFKHIKDKIIAFAPQTSIIGRLLYQDYKITIVDSEKTLFNQHNLYNWNIEEVQFKKLDKFTYLSNKIDDVVKHNLEKLSYDEKVEFVESLFGIIKEMSKDDVIQFEDNLWSFFLRFNKILKTKSEETKKLIYSIFKKDKNSEPIKRIEPLKNKDSKIKEFFNRFKKEKRDIPDIIENEIDN